MSPQALHTITGLREEWGPTAPALHRMIEHDLRFSVIAAAHQHVAEAVLGQQG